MAHALILGASGISGWSIVNQARLYPTPDTFTRITGTTNRPLTLQQAHLPEDPRLQLVSGIDFTKSVEEVVGLLREKIADVETVTHVFFTAYIHTDDFQTLKQVNTSLIEVAIQAIEKTSPNLKAVILQTGGKGYGLEFPDKVAVRPPLKESLPRIPEPWGSNIFYYSQYDVLARLSQGKQWTYSEIRPDAITGFTPTTTPMNLAQGLGLYFSLYREAKGAGATVPFPGSEKGWRSLHTDTFQDILSKMEIFAALNTDKCGNGESFNVADGEVISWSQVWPRLCEYYGLVGGGPVEAPVSIADFVKENKQAWLDLAKKYGLREDSIDKQEWWFTHFIVVEFDFDRQYDLSKAREVGFNETIDTVDGYIKSWERMVVAKILPPRDA